MPQVIRSIMRRANAIYAKANTAVQNGVGTIVDSTGQSVREIPGNPVPFACTNYVLAVSDSGKFINVTPAVGGGSFVTIPQFTFMPGQIIRIYNSGLQGNIMVKPGPTTTPGYPVILHTPNTISLGSGANTIVGPTGSRNVAPQGIATLMCVIQNTFVLHGPGVNSAVGGV